MYLIIVIDSIMGSGKTTWAISYMNRSTQRKFIFATPFLKEDERIRNGCPSLHFVEPDAAFSKLADLKKLIASGKNIATTHALLDHWIPSPKDIDNLRKWNYTLILDEAIEVITPVQQINADDLALLLDDMVEVDAATNQVRWIAETCPQRYKDIQKLADADRLNLCRGSQLLNVMPVDLFKAVPNIMIMTFLFEASHLCHYMRIHNMHWHIAHIQNGHLCMGEQNLAQKKAEIRVLLSIYEGKYNLVEEEKKSLTATFWSSTEKRKDRYQVIKNIRSFFLTFCHTHMNQSMWATFKSKDHSDMNNVPGFKQAFVPFNSKATNSFADRTCLAYAVNVHDNPMILAWFYEHDQRPDQDLFALSAMIQWIWRSAIRNGQSIRLYLPSKRMRTLLGRWLDS